MNIQGSRAATPSAPRRRPRLTITAGPISSGKSSWVRSFQEHEGHPLCLIRDDVRADIGGEGYLGGPVDPETEEAVTTHIKTEVTRALSEGTDVYLDGCNNHPLTRNHWESLATENSAEFRLMFFDLPLERLVALNDQRKTPHPRAKVEASHRFWNEQFKKVADRPQHHFINGERPLA